MRDINTALIVAEVFYSIQGEGQTMGTPAVFLRLGGCNLLCKSKDWTCDTIDVWKHGRIKKFPDTIPEEYIGFLQNGAHLVITGGEPLLQDYAIVDYLNWLRSTYKFTPIIEVETNGTLSPSDMLIDKVDYWNVSPKLPNSGESYDRRVNNAALLKIMDQGRNSIFKFVVGWEEDIIAIGDDYEMINPTRIMLMPAGDTVATLQDVRLRVVEMCKRYCYRYSDRLHISLWDKKTGV